MKKLVAVALVGLSFLLSSCGPEIVTHYRYQTPHSFRGRRCVNSCMNAFQSCRLQCTQINDQRMYFQQSQQDYNNRMAARHGYIAPMAFYQGPQHCGCRNTYNQCYSNCGGAVFVSKHCVANCS